MLPLISFFVDPAKLQPNGANQYFGDIDESPSGNAMVNGMTRFRVRTKLQKRNNTYAEVKSITNARYLKFNHEGSTYIIGIIEGSKRASDKDNNIHDPYYDLNYIVIRTNSSTNSSLNSIDSGGNFSQNKLPLYLYFEDELIGRKVKSGSTVFTSPATDQNIEISLIVAHHENISWKDAIKSYIETFNLTVNKTPNLSSKSENAAFRKFEVVQNFISLNAYLQDYSRMGCLAKFSTSSETIYYNSEQYYNEIASLYFESEKNNIYIYIYDNLFRSYQYISRAFINSKLQIGYLPKPSSTIASSTIDSKYSNSNWPICTFFVDNSTDYIAFDSKTPLRLEINNNPNPINGFYLESGTIISSNSTQVPHFNNLKKNPIFTKFEIEVNNSLSKIYLGNLPSNSTYFLALETLNVGNYPCYCSSMRIQLLTEIQPSKKTLISHNLAFLSNVIKLNATNGVNTYYLDKVNTPDFMCFKSRKNIIFNHIETYKDNSTTSPTLKESYLFTARFETYFTLKRVNSSSIISIDRIELEKLDNYDVNLTNIDKVNLVERNSCLGITGKVIAYRSNNDTRIMPFEFSSKLGPTLSSPARIGLGYYHLYHKLKYKGFQPYRLSNSKTIIEDASGFKETTYTIGYYDNSQNANFNLVEDQVFYKDTDSMEIPIEFENSNSMLAVLPSNIGISMTLGEFEFLTDLVKDMIQNPNVEDFNDVFILLNLTSLNLAVKNSLIQNIDFIDIRSSSNNMNFGTSNTKYIINYAIRLSLSLLVANQIIVNFVVTSNNQIANTASSPFLSEFDQSDNPLGDINNFKYNWIINNYLPLPYYFISCKSSQIEIKSRIKVDDNLLFIRVVQNDILCNNRADYNTIFSVGIVNNPYLVFSKFNDGLFVYLLKEIKSFRRVINRAILQYKTPFIHFTSEYDNYSTLEPDPTDTTRKRITKKKPYVAVTKTRIIGIDVAQPLAKINQDYSREYRSTFLQNRQNLRNESNDNFYYILPTSDDINIFRYDPVVISVVNVVFDISFSTKLISKKDDNAHYIDGNIFVTQEIVGLTHEIIPAILASLVTPQLDEGYQAFICRYFQRDPKLCHLVEQYTDNLDENIVDFMNNISDDRFTMLDTNTDRISLLNTSVPAQNEDKKKYISEINARMSQISLNPAIMPYLNYFTNDKLINSSKLYSKENLNTKKDVNRKISYYDTEHTLVSEKFMNNDLFSVATEVMSLLLKPKDYSSILEWEGRRVSNMKFNNGDIACILSTGGLESTRGVRHLYYFTKQGDYLTNTFTDYVGLTNLALSLSLKILLSDRNLLQYPFELNSKHQYIIHALDKVSFVVDQSNLFLTVTLTNSQVNISSTPVVLRQELSYQKMLGL